MSLFPENQIHAYHVERQRLVDGGFTCESFSGNEQVMKRFQWDISKLKNVSPCNMRILHNPIKNQYELYVWRKKPTEPTRRTNESVHVFTTTRRRTFA